MTVQAFQMSTSPNDAAHLKTLSQLSPPLLKDYGADEYALTEWHDFDSMEFSGARVWTKIGLPWFKITLFRVFRADFAYLKTLEGATMTVHVYNQSASAYQNFNATLKIIETNSNDAKFAADGIGGFQDVVLTFYDLVGI